MMTLYAQRSLCYVVPSAELRHNLKRQGDGLMDQPSLSSLRDIRSGTRLNIAGFVAKGLS
jgi:hypothetical protein